MTLRQIWENGARYALNEITGQVIEFASAQRMEEQCVLVPGTVSSHTDMLSLLFDQETIDRNWNHISRSEAHRRRSAYTLLCGCFSCERLD